MKRRGAIWFVFFLTSVAAALILRCGDLDSRPLHNDEAINAVKVEALWDRGHYRYDPHEFHGPALYYLSIPVLKVVSWFRPDQPDETGMRGVSVVCGLGVIVLLGACREAMGKAGLVAVAALTAVSPAMVYYSRYYIHEMMLVGATFLLLTALWRYSRRPGMSWAVCGGAALGWMYATKETFVFAVAAGVIAWVVVMAFDRGRMRGGDQENQAGNGRWREAATRLLGLARGVPKRHVAGALGAATLVAVVLFTSFFTHWQGAVDAVRTYTTWLTRAGGETPHVHAWSFYLERLAWFHGRGGPYWTEGAVLLLALWGGVAAWCWRGGSLERRRVMRFVSVYSVVLAAIYSAIPYKTPWCLLGFYHGMLVLAGMGIGVMWEWTGRGWQRAVVVVVGVAVAGHLVLQSRRATRPEWAADFRNPYVYGHTSADVVNLLELVKGLAKASGQGERMPIQVMAPEANYWPLPWYWRRFQSVGWWDAIPENLYAPVVVAASRLQAGLEEKSERAWWQAGMFELRPRFFVEVYVEKGLWDRYLAGRAGAAEEGSPPEG